MLDWLFHKSSAAAPAPERDWAALLAPHRQPALKLNPSATGKCYCGGSPALPAYQDWPHGPDGKPLRFLAAIHMESAQATLAVPWLPRTGELLFFYDDINQPWGGHPDDSSGWAVLHTDGSGKLWPDLSRVKFDLAVTQTIPSLERLPDLALSARDEERFEEFRRRASEETRHQLGGFPLDIQGDEMELQCQLASHGVDPASDFAAHQMERLKPGATDWRLLLQLDSDADLGFYWGDSGLLYFWIREQDARRADFSKVWAILQSY